MLVAALVSAAFVFSAGAQAATPVSVLAPTAADAAAAAATPPVPVGVLTSDALPERYRIDLTLDPAQPTFSGHVEIDVKLARASSTIDLHGRDLDVTRVAARTPGGETLVGHWRGIDPTGVVRLSFDRLLPAGPVTLAFDYTGRFADFPAGLFRVKVGADWYNWSQFQSIDARAAFPSFDQPSFKTPFEITLRTQPGMMAISNAPQTGITRESGLDVHRFAPTLPLPTYLVAVMTGPFAAVDGTVAPTPQRAAPLPLRVVSTRQNAGKLDFALDGSEKIVALLEDYFADGFPYPKLDQITSPIMPGAMENAGADLYRDSILVMDRNAPVPQQRYFGMVVAHELAHQWFGDLVTPMWWDDIWLNESFANWMGYRIGHEWRPDLNIGAGALEEGFAAMDTDALLAGRPIRQRITENSQIDGAFDSITYGKGGHVVAMIAAFLGDERFRDGVRRYMAAHRYGNATSDDFFAAMAAAGGNPRIVPAMQSFIDQQGVPLLTFTPEGGGWRVSQQRYAPFGVQPPATAWVVPMCVRRGAERECQLLDQSGARIAPAGAAALVPNADGAGYYRFELSDADWAALIAGAGSLSSGEALAVSDSLGASVRAGRAHVTQLAALARALSRHSDTYASDAAMAELSALVTKGLVDARGRNGWARFRGALFGPLLAEYGFDPRAGAYAGENPERIQARAQLIGRIDDTSAGKKVRKHLLAAAQAFLGGDTAALDPMWFDEALSAYVARGGESAARVLLDRALASEDPVFRPAALAAVAGSGNKAVARWLLYDLADPRLRISERHDAFGSIIMTRMTRDIGYDWISANFDSVTSANSGIFLARRLPGLFGRFCSVAKADEIAALYRPRFAGTPGALELERVIETIRNCGTLETARGAIISKDFAALK